MIYKFRIFFISFFIFTTLSGIFCQGNKLPLKVGNFGNDEKPLIFHISGDGGWRGFDVKMAEEYKNNRLSFIALNSLKYFWVTKTPAQFANDIVPMLNDSLKTRNKKELIIVGFSFGAEIIPFLFTRLPDDLKKKVRLLVLITPARTSDFTIHLSDMMGEDHDYAYDVEKEVEKINETKVLAVFGEKETTSFPVTLKKDNLKIIFVKGSHHFTNAKAVMDLILPEF